MSHSFQGVQLLAVITGLASTSLSLATPLPKERNCTRQSKSFGVLVNSVQCPRPGDAVDVFVEEVGSHDDIRVIPLLTRFPVSAVRMN